MCSSKVTPEGRLAYRIGVARSSAFPLCSNVHAAASSTSPFILATWSMMLDRGCIGVTLTLCLLPARAMDRHGSDRLRGASGTLLVECSRSSGTGDEIAEAVRGLRKCSPFSRTPKVVAMSFTGTSAIRVRVKSLISMFALLDHTEDRDDQRAPFAHIQRSTISANNTLIFGYRIAESTIFTCTGSHANSLEQVCRVACAFTC